MNKVCAVVLAHNEADTLPRTLRILKDLKQKGSIRDIVVVDDGSVDNTAKIAAREGAIVVSHIENLGKKEGFISGAMMAKKLGAEVLLSLDADIHKLPEESIRSLIEPLKVEGKLMSVGIQYEYYRKDYAGVSGLIKNIFGKKKVSHQIDHSILAAGGIIKNQYSTVQQTHSTFLRAINMVALDPLFNNNPKWVGVFRARTNHPPYISGAKHSKKWGLELALDQLIPQNKIKLVDAPVWTAKPFRKPGRNEGAQELARRNIYQEISARNIKAKKIRNLRVKILLARKRNDKKTAVRLMKKARQLRNK